MNSFWKTIVDGLTYTDLAGKRQPRLYTVLAGLILFLLLMAGGLAGLNRFILMRQVQQDPIPVSLTPAVPEVVENKKTTQAAKNASSRCPTDVSQWSFSPTPISDTYLTIQPACVYHELERTIAWALAIRQGYSRAEAMRQLGFDRIPIQPLSHVTIPRNADDLMDVPVSFIPPHPNLREWRLNQKGESAVIYALRGCFKTSNIVGNRLEIWGGDYTVICLVVEDAENKSIVYALDEHIYTSKAIPMRSFLLFGYDIDESWVWLGTQTEPKIEITDRQVNANERLTVATLYDSQPWDAKWLLDRYHLGMQPLPEHWQSMTNEDEKIFILNALAESPDGATP